MSDTNRAPVEKTGVAAAQGRTGTPIVKVLVISTLLAAVVLFGLYAILGAKTSHHPGGGGQSGTDSRAAASTFHTAPASPEPVAPAGETKEGGAR